MECSERSQQPTSDNGARYNIEQILGVVKAAENCRSPLIIQVFPWQITFSDGLLVHTASLVAKAATVPVSIHLDHCQHEDMVKHAADNLPFDSIMIDMSHYERAENIAKTQALVAYCHEHGITTEAEPGRIEGGEDGIADTADMTGMLTTPDEVADFVGAGVDFLAPAFGNVHGEYGPRGPQLDLNRLDSISHQCKRRNVRVVVHGTNDWKEDMMQDVIRRGVSKINVNKLVLNDYNNYLKDAAPTTTITKLMEGGVDKVVGLTEDWMRKCGSAGRA